MNYNLETSSELGTNLDVPNVGAAKYAGIHFADNPNFSLDNPDCVRNHKVTAS